MDDTTTIKSLTDSDEDFAHISRLWQSCFPDWPIAQERLYKILYLVPGGHHYIHAHGFCLSILQDGVHGKLAAVGVSPDFRNRGLGSAFAKHSLNGLKAAAEGELQSFEEAKNWIKRRGFRVAPERGARDMFKDIRSETAPPEIMSRVAQLNLKCSPLTPELYEQCIVKQRALFSWSKVYEVLAAYNQHHEILVAFDPNSNEQIGWTLMCSPSAIISDTFAFLPLMPSKEKTGLIAAVGVDDKFRGKGVSIALVVKAMKNLRERGVEGVLVDDVHIDGFYEKLGFETWWQYEKSVYEI